MSTYRYFWVILGLFCCYFGVILVYFWVIFGLFLVYFWVILGIFWGYFGIFWGLFWGYYGVIVYVCMYASMHNNLAGKKFPPKKFPPKKIANKISRKKNFLKKKILIFFWLGPKELEKCGTFSSFHSKSMWICECRACGPTSYLCGSGSTTEGALGTAGGTHITLVWSQI